MFQALKQWVSDRRSGVTLFLTVAVSVLFLLRGSQSGPTFVRWAALRLVSAGQNVLALPIHLARLDQENRFLRGQLLSHLLYESELRRLRQENARLRVMLEFREAAEYELRAADVLGHDAETPPTTITIDVGSLNGVQSYQAVMSAEGLVGRIASEPSTTVSAVRLLSDHGVRVSVVVENEARPMGVVQWLGGGLQLTNVPVELPVEVGDRIVTSGLGGVFPEGIPVGFVKEVTDDPHALFKTITVRPAARLDRIEEVFVIRSSRPDSSSGGADVLAR